VEAPSSSSTAVGADEPQEASSLKSYEQKEVVLPSRIVDLAKVDSQHVVASGKKKYEGVL